MGIPRYLYTRKLQRYEGLQHTASVAASCSVGKACSTLHLLQLHAELGRLATNCICSSFTQRWEGVLHTASIAASCRVVCKNSFSGRLATQQPSSKQPALRITSLKWESESESHSRCCGSS